MSRIDDIDYQIWHVTTEMPSKQQLQVYRSDKIGADRRDREDEARRRESNPTKAYKKEIGDTVRMSDQEHRGALAIWMTLKLLADRGPNAWRFVPGRQKGLVFDIWALITSFAIGDNTADIFSPLNTVANYAVCLKDRPITRGLFPVTFHPDILVQAVLHGDETMSRHILKTNPDLTQIGTGIDFSGRQFTGTAFQAVIAAIDFAPNKNSTGLGELIVEQLKHQHPYKRRQILHDQPLELYVNSLHYYTEKQADKIRMLMGKQGARTALEAEKQRYQAYCEAIDSNDLATIINVHADAQKNHVFQVDRALIDAIGNATDAQIQAVLDDSTIDSPLSNLLKQFRADFTKLSHEEIIFNPQHLLEAYADFHIIAHQLRGVNWRVNSKKFELFSCHLVGFMQRYLPASIAQLYAQPVFYLGVNVNKNYRGFGFRHSWDKFFPLNFDSHVELGYQFVASLQGRAVQMLTDNRWSFTEPQLFEDIYLAKIKSFHHLLRDQGVRLCDRGSRKRPREFA